MTELMHGVSQKAGVNLVKAPLGCFRAQVHFGNRTVCLNSQPVERILSCSLMQGHAEDVRGPGARMIQYLYRPPGMTTSVTLLKRSY